MRIGVPSEHGQIERRVALTPDAAKRLTDQGLEVLIETGAGIGSALPDGEYMDAGAGIAGSRDQLLTESDVILLVGRPDDELLGKLRSGTALIGMLQPLINRELVDRLAAAGVTACSLDAIPRITRSQSMDALSSQATVAGYKAVLISAELLPRFFPMLMTAAGTVPPAKVFVLGAGVAGLQAIATARRLGAVVSAFDTRPVVKEQVESLGATFVELELEVTEGEDARGYARELTAEQHAQEQDLVERTVGESDVAITTALIPGRPAPRLITARRRGCDAAGLGDRRPGGRDRRQLRADRPRTCRRTRRSDHRRHAQPPLHHAAAREPDVCAQHHQPAGADRLRRRAPARLQRRDRCRRLHHARRPDRVEAADGSRGMTALLVSQITVLVLAAFVGFEVISKVPTTLHTPLMSGTNAIHGIVIVGAIIVVGSTNSLLVEVLGTIAVTFGAINVAGGFLVTDRMLNMFKSRPGERRDDG